MGTLRHGGGGPFIFRNDVVLQRRGFAPRRMQHGNGREVLRCSGGVARKESCTAFGRTAFTPCRRAHSQPSIRARGEKVRPVHGRTGVSSLHTLHPSPLYAFLQHACVSPRRRSKASTVASGVGVTCVTVLVPEFQWSALPIHCGTFKFKFYLQYKDIMMVLQNGGEEEDIICTCHSTQGYCRGIRTPEVLTSLRGCPQPLAWTQRSLVGTLLWSFVTNKLPLWKSQL